MDSPNNELDNFVMQDVEDGVLISKQPIHEPEAKEEVQVCSENIFILNHGQLLIRPAIKIGDRLKHILEEKDGLVDLGYQHVTRLRSERDNIKIELETAKKVCDFCGFYFQTA